jgi:hypothetical protein
VVNQSAKIVGLIALRLARWKGVSTNIGLSGKRKLNMNEPDAGVENTQSKLRKCGGELQTSFVLETNLL